MGAVKPVGELSPTVLTKQCLARDRYFIYVIQYICLCQYIYICHRYFIYVIQTLYMSFKLFVERKRPRYRNTATTRGHGRPIFDVNTKFAAEFRFFCI